MRKTRPEAASTQHLKPAKEALEPGDRNPKPKQSSDLKQKAQNT
jgi:hypothetical protein